MGDLERRIYRSLNTPGRPRTTWAFHGTWFDGVQEHVILSNRHTGRMFLVGTEKEWDDLRYRRIGDRDLPDYVPKERRNA